MPVVPHQAVIEVFEGEGSPQSSLDQVVAHYLGSSGVLSRRKFLSSAGASGCSPIIEVVSKEPIVPLEDVSIPVDNVMNDGFFCELHGRKMVVLLRYIERSNKASYRRVALRMINSLRGPETH